MSPFFNPTYIISILIALSVHEWAHAYTANRLGDPTPGQNGRLTLNPVAHLDPLGALMFFLIGFGWAKPVPVDGRYFARPKRDLSLVAVAGPLSNLVLAVMAFTALFFMTNGGALSIDALLAQPQTATAYAVLLKILQSSLFVNLALMAFNLLPVPPLDGSNILQFFIPLRHERQYEEFLRVGPFILIGVIIAENILHIPIISWWVLWIVGGVLSLFDILAGFF